MAVISNQSFNSSSNTIPTYKSARLNDSIDQFSPWLFYRNTWCLCWDLTAWVPASGTGIACSSQNPGGRPTPPPRLYGAIPDHPIQWFQILRATTCVCLTKFAQHEPLPGFQHPQSQPKASLCKRLRLPQAYENRVFSFGRGQLEHLAELQGQFQLYQGT